MEKFLKNLFFYIILLDCSSNCQKQLYLFYILENLINYKENIFFNYRG